MAKQIVKILDDLSPSQMKLRDISRPPNGLKNMIINELGQVEKRKGYEKYNKVPLNEDNAILGMHRFYNEEDKTKEFLVACYDRLYKIDEAYPHEGNSLSSNEGV